MSSKRKTKYNKLWESEFHWIQPCKGDVNSANCKLCQKTFSISGSGLGQVKSHSNSQLHLSREKESEGQSHFSKDSDNTLTLKGPLIRLTDDELVRKAEIIRALEVVASNYSFASTNNDGEV